MTGGENRDALGHCGSSGAVRAGRIDRWDATDQRPPRFLRPLPRYGPERWCCRSCVASRRSDRDRPAFAGEHRGHPVRPGVATGCKPGFTCRIARACRVVGIHTCLDSINSPANAPKEMWASAHSATANPPDRVSPSQATEASATEGPAGLNKLGSTVAGIGREPSPLTASGTCSTAVV